MVKLPRKALIGFILWNAVIAGLWIWCREGSVVNLRFTVEGNHHCLYRDDVLVDCHSVPESKMLTHGMPGLGLSRVSRAPLPVAPQEFSDLTVKDLYSDELLLDNTIINGFDDWTMLRGTFDLTPQGRIRSKHLAMGAIGSMDWEDYAIEVTLFNPTEAFILHRVQDRKNYGRIKMRFWRELVVGFSYYKDGKQTFHRLKSLSESVEDNIRSMLLRSIKVYAVAVGVITAFLLLFVLLSMILRPFLGAEQETN